MVKALVLYHYLHPDDVVSAVHFSDLCQGLVQQGWNVDAMPCNRSCRHATQAYSAAEDWQGVRIRRIWRPGFSQASGIGRLANAAWMLFRWSVAVLSHRPDVVIIGTDPILSIVVAGFWKTLRPQTKVAHWCFDLYPEAAFADGIARPDSLAARALKPILKWSYGACDLIADLGPCMRERLRAYESKGHAVTLTPWALAEPGCPVPIDTEERADIFGEAPLALLYSGSFGRAHSSELILELARRLEPEGTSIVFSVRGNRVDALQREASPHPNVRFVPFAEAASLEARLSAADVHIVSLREEWTGTVVPSKFFGALAVGRPVLFVGSERSSLAQWVREHQVGWVLTPESLDQVCDELRKLSCNPLLLRQLFDHCHAVYAEHYSKRAVIDRWDTELRTVVEGAE